MAVWSAGRACGRAAANCSKGQPRGPGFKPPTATTERGRQEAPLSARPPCVEGGGGREGSAGPRGERAPLARIPAKRSEPGRGRAVWVEPVRGAALGSGGRTGARSREPPPGSARAPAAALAPAGLRRSGRPAALRGWTGEGGPAAFPHPPPPRPQCCLFYSIWCCLPAPDDFF